MDRKSLLFKSLLTWLVIIGVTRATDIVPFGSNWSYLQILDGLDGDPAFDNPNFVEEWFTPDYDTSDWTAPSAAPFAYGAPDEFGNENVFHIQVFTEESFHFERPVGTFLPQPPGDRYTTYFRHNFTTETDLDNLGIEFFADDGMKVYLDGAEVFNFNCCEISNPGEVAEYAELSLGVAREDLYQPAGILDGQVLPAGDHVLAVEIHQQAPDSSDMGFSLRVHDNGYVDNTIIPKGDQWRFFRGTEEPANGTLDWARPGFDDAAWEIGAEGFGYEAGNDPLNSVEDLVQTEIDDMNGNYSSLYVRKAFDVPEDVNYHILTFEVDFDDHVFAYVNGEIVGASFNDPALIDLGEAIPFDTTANDFGTQNESTNGSGAPGAQVIIDLNDYPDLLNPGGKNIIALHGINALPSSDFVLAQLELIGLGEGGTIVVGIPGDFDNDTDLDEADINALSAAVRNNSQNSQFDLNADGNVDNDDRLVWINELRGTYIGDSNLDGEFSSRDFVLVFATNEFEDAIDGNSGWEDGDWNGDGDFTTSDFVEAFVAGGYELGPREQVAAVPEPASLVLIVVGLMSMYGMRQKQA